MGLTHMAWCYRINPHEVNCHQTNYHDQICYQIKSNFLGKKSIISTYDNILDLLFMSQLVEKPAYLESQLLSQLTRMAYSNRLVCTCHVMPIK